MTNSQRLAEKIEDEWAFFASAALPAGQDNLRDVVHDAFVEQVEKDTWPDQSNKLGSWFWARVRWKALQYLRRPIIADTLEDWAEYPAIDPPDAEDLTRPPGLTELQWEALHLNAHVPSLTEAASLLGTNKKAYQGRLHQARVKARRQRE